VARAAVARGAPAGATGTAEGGAKLRAPARAGPLSALLLPRESVALRALPSSERCAGRRRALHRRRTPLTTYPQTLFVSPRFLRPRPRTAGGGGAATRRGAAPERRWALHGVAGSASTGASASTTPATLNALVATGRTAGGPLWAAASAAAASAALTATGATGSAPTRARGRGSLVGTARGMRCERHARGLLAAGAAAAAAAGCCGCGLWLFLLLSSLSCHLG